MVQMFCPACQVVAPGAKSAVYACIVLQMKLSLVAVVAVQLTVQDLLCRKFFSNSVFTFH